MNQRYKNIAGIILSGGQSERIGKDKALLELDGKSIIEIVISKIRNLFQEIIIITNSPANYKFLNLPLYNDVYPGFGPIAGVHSGLKNSPTEKSFIISCDMPFVSEKIIQTIIDFKSEKKIVIPVYKKKTYFLCGIYNKEVAETAESIILSSQKNDGIKKNKKLSLWNLASKSGAEEMDFSNFTGIDEKAFFNMNTNEDYIEAKNYFEESGEKF